MVSFFIKLNLAWLCYFSGRACIRPYSFRLTFFIQDFPIESDAIQQEKLFEHFEHHMGTLLKSMGKEM